MADRRYRKDVEHMFELTTRALEAVGIAPGPGEEWLLHRSMSYYALRFRDVNSGGHGHVPLLSEVLGHTATEAWNTLQAIYLTALAVAHAQRQNGADQ